MFASVEQRGFLALLNEMLSFKNVVWENLIVAIQETLYMTLVSTFYVFVIGLILGLFLYLTGPNKVLANRFVNFLLAGIINVFRSIPFIILLVLLIPFTRSIMGTIIGPKAQFQLWLSARLHFMLD